MMLSGLPVVVDKNCESREWVYPRERFWSYEPSKETEQWCRYFGFGHDEYKPAMYRVGGTLIVHPAIWDRIKKEAKEQSWSMATMT